METTPELVIFLIIGAVAIISAVMMLISENAVHSALFLVINFACVAFFFLMLNAAFLFLVQITVYAGAIMVLFMFVIMLLGAERVLPEAEPRFPWLTPVATALTTVFLLVAGYGIIQADITTTEPEPLAPTVRVVNAAADFETVDVYLNGELLTEELIFRQESDLQAWSSGEYEITIAHHGEDPVAISVLTPPHAEADKTEAGDHSEDTDAEEHEDDAEATEENSESAEASEGEADGESTEAEGEHSDAEEATAELLPYVMLDYNTDNTLVITEHEDGSYIVIPVLEDLNTVELRRQAKVQIVHAAADIESVDFAEMTQDDQRPNVLFEDVAFGSFTEVETIRDGQTDFGIFEAGLIAEELALDEDADVRDMANLAETSDEEYIANASTLFVVSPALRPDVNVNPDLLHFRIDNRPSFGGPVGIGQSLFTDYMLPFQVIALLLLASMIGAIVLTRDAVPPARKRFPRRNALTGDPVAGEPSQD